MAGRRRAGRSGSPRVFLPAVAVALALGAAALAVSGPNRRADADARPAGRDPALARELGAGSCAARGCHGGVGPVDPTQGSVAVAGGEYTTWRTFDPHADAGRVLLSDRSKRMARLLSRQLGGKPAHLAAECRSCHAPATWTPAPPDETLDAGLREGVGCESCHGPASRWRDAHLAAAWRAQDPAVKARSKLADLTHADGRARACVGCHVGSGRAGREVNHDFIAAGHPRLNFEFASSLANYPRHWSGADPDGEAKAWAIAQAEIAVAGVDLLAHRAEAEASGKPSAPPWPELSEYGCFACHRSLPANPDAAPAGSPARAAGSPMPWASWSLAALPALAAGRPEVDPLAPDSVWAPLRAAMTADEPDPVEVARRARAASEALGWWAIHLRDESFDGARIDDLAKRLAGDPAAIAGLPWDDAAQRYLGLAALARSRGGADGAGLPAEARDFLRLAPKLLPFPPGYDGPRRPHPLGGQDGTGAPPR